MKECIAKCQSFDDDQLGYVDFLEALVRIAHAFPFNEEELADMVTFEMRVLYFVQKLDAKFSKLKEKFLADMANQNEKDQQGATKYNPRLVLEEDENSDYDMDN